MVTADREAEYRRIAAARLKASAVTPRQVQAAWVKQANAGLTAAFSMWERRGRTRQGRVRRKWRSRSLHF
jgi:hypothetical protein